MCIEAFTLEATCSQSGVECASDHSMCMNEGYWVNKINSCNWCCYIWGSETIAKGLRTHLWRGNDRECSALSSPPQSWSQVQQVFSFVKFPTVQNQNLIGKNDHLLSRNFPHWKSKQMNHESLLMNISSSTKGGLNTVYLVYLMYQMLLLYAFMASC